VYDGEHDEYRYLLERRLAPEGPTLLFVMLNPSTATEAVLDPTVARCHERARRLRCARLLVANLFALRATDPRAVYESPSPVGPENDAWIARAAIEADLVVAAWGVHGALHDRGAHVAALLRANARGPLLVLGLTKHGHPRHPLYLPHAAKLVSWS
jgi:hypothetical protein